MNIDRLPAMKVFQLFTFPMSEMAERAWTAMPEHKRQLLLASMELQNSMASEPIGETFVPLRTPPLTNLTLSELINLSATQRQRLIGSVKRVSAIDIDGIRDAEGQAVHRGIYISVLLNRGLATEEDFHRYDLAEERYRNAVDLKKKHQHYLVENEDIYQKLLLLEPDETLFCGLLLQCL